eukprot:5131593-Amphidinium_carterae.1
MGKKGQDAGKRVLPAGSLQLGQSSRASATASSTGPASKKARTFVKDEKCSCSLCKESPEDLFSQTSNRIWEHPCDQQLCQCYSVSVKNWTSKVQCLFNSEFHEQFEQERSWALYAQSGIGARIPQGDQCAECFDLWHKAFKYMGWPGFCKLNSEDDGFSKIVDEARQVMLGKKQPPQLGAYHVDSLTQLGVEVHRSYIAVSEKEMRRESQQTRIKKSSLKGIPSVVVPAEDGSGEMEQLFLFQDPSQPWRKATLKVTDAVVRNQPHMLETCLWAGQPGKYHTMATQQLFEQNGVQQVLEKDVAGHTSLPTWDTFLEERLLGCKDIDEVEPLAGDLAEHVAGDALEFSGPAAAVGTAVPSLITTPSSKSKVASQKKGDKAGGPLQRLFSSSSVMEQGDNADAASVHGPAGSLAGESVAGRSDMDDENLTGVGGLAEGCGKVFCQGWKQKHRVCKPVLSPPSCAAGADALSYWKQKCDLQKLLEGKQDLRTLTGLQRAVSRRLGNEETYPIGASLNTLLKLATACKNLSPKFFPATTQEDLHNTLAKLEHETVELPYSLKYNILMRRVNMLVKEKKYTELVQ